MGAGITTDKLTLDSESGVFLEDDAHNDADAGMHVLAVRNDVEGSLVDSDGDYGSLQLDDLGRLRVVADLDMSALAEKIEDDPHVTGDTGNFVLAVREDTPAASTSDDGDYQAFKGDELGKMWSNISANSSSFNADVDVGIAATQLVTSSIAGRIRLLVQNLGPQSIFVGNVAVTADTGIRISKNGSHTFEVGGNIDLYAISSVAQSGANNTRVMETA